MPLRRKTYDGAFIRRSDGYTKWGNSLDSQIQTNELLTSKRTRLNRRKIDEDTSELLEESNPERYLLTYADLITLLLGLFIILYAISNVDVAKYEKMMENMGDYFGNPKVIEQQTKSDIIDLSDGKDKLKTSIESFVKEYGYANNIKIVENERGIVISILDNILFNSGNAELSEESKPILNKMAQLLKTLPNDIRIEGHTDNVPIETAEFPSNWHLSMARATNTAYYLMHEQGMKQERVSVVGNSEFKPVAANDTPESRSLNRRVDIVILNK